MMFPFLVSLTWDYASDENRQQPMGAWGNRKRRKIVCLFAQQKATICAALFCLIRNRACFARFPNPRGPADVGFLITGSIPFSCPAEPLEGIGRHITTWHPFEYYGNGEIQAI
jgi:hypothetical protein